MPLSTGGPLPQVGAHPGQSMQGAQLRDGRYRGSRWAVEGQKCRCRGAGGPAVGRLGGCLTARWALSPVPAHLAWAGGALGHLGSF